MVEFVIHEISPDVREIFLRIKAKIRTKNNEETLSFLCEFYEFHSKVI